MTIYDYLNRKVPRYYPTMYQDGFTPMEILAAAHQTMYEDFVADQDDDEVEITIK